VLESGIPQGHRAYTLIAVCIAFSIVAHSSTDVPTARMFDVEDLVGIPDDETATQTPAANPDADPSAEHPAGSTLTDGAPRPRAGARSEEADNASA